MRLAIPDQGRPRDVTQLLLMNDAVHGIWVRAVHTKGGQAQMSLQGKSWLGGTETLPLTLPRQGIDFITQGLRIWIPT